MANVRYRRLKLILIFVVAALLFGGSQLAVNQATQVDLTQEQSSQLYSVYVEAAKKLPTLEVKGRAAKTGYSRANFGSGWGGQGACDTRNIILNRDLSDVVVDHEKCQILSGVLDDPYTGERIVFKRGADSSGRIQIDHVVALSDAWQKGAQRLSFDRRVSFANDPLNLLAVDGPANQAKADSDAASWLPPNKAFRCQYVSRQVEVKFRYDLWVTEAEKRTIEQLLSRCIKNSG